MFRRTSLSRVRGSSSAVQKRMSVKKKARSESSINITDKTDSKPVSYAAPSNDAEDKQGAQCIDLSESQADVICID